MTPSKEKVKDIVYGAVAMASARDIEELTDHTELITTLDMDSLAIFELAIELEDVFGLQIPDEDIERIVTIKDAVEYIEGQLK